VRRVAGRAARAAVGDRIERTAPRFDRRGVGVFRDPLRVAARGRVVAGSGVAAHGALAVRAHRGVDAGRGLGPRGRAVDRTVDEIVEVGVLGLAEAADPDAKAQESGQEREAHEGGAELDSSFQNVTRTPTARLLNQGVTSPD
jgi:hypothetical protein